MLILIFVFHDFNKREKPLEEESLLQVQVNAATWDMVAVAASVPLQKDKSQDGLGLCVENCFSSL